MRELFLFVRPPRPVLPFDEPSVPLWPPLAYACLAAALRHRVPEIAVDILDAPALRMGWASLEAELRRRRPRWMGVGEEAIACVEVFRLARLAKELNVSVIGGGAFFGNLAPQTLATGLIDVVVHDEGEETLVDLVRALLNQTPDTLLDVAGISFRQNQEVHTTRQRPLVASLDDLPLPAFDLQPLQTYGAASRNYPHLGSLELSRGCLRNCSYCASWRQLGKRVNDPTSPTIRVKSVERVFEEIQLLVQRHDRRYLGWVDPCFNADPNIPGQVAERLLSQQVRVGQSASLNPHCIPRDAASGALKACVEAGLNEVHLHFGYSLPGRPSEPDPAAEMDAARKAMDILRREHPEVFVFGSFPYGLPGDTPATMRTLHDSAVRLGVDAALFVPITPFPGTPAWKPECWDVTGETFRHLHLLPDSVVNLHQRELEDTLDRLSLFSWSEDRLRNYWNHFTARDSRRRSQRWSWLGRSARFHIRNFFRKAALGPEESSLLRFPSWYES